MTYTTFYKLENYQEILFPYAYNILGSSEDAKDAIQDVLTRYLSSLNPDIENVTGYLVKAVINQAINLKKKQQRINKSIWLPEPIATENADSNLQTEQILSYSLMVIMENLNPRERAVFILKEVFNYSHTEVAEVINSTVENSRKLLSRARARLATRPKEFIHQLKDHSENMERYINSIKLGDTKALEQMLSKDISVSADGGGVFKVIREFTSGIKPAKNLMLHVFKTYQQSQAIRFSEINHQPALLFFENDILVNCQVFEWNDQGSRIQSIYSILDPAKLATLKLH